MSEGREGAGGSFREGVMDGSAEAAPEFSGFLGGCVGNRGRGFEGEDFYEFMFFVVGELEKRSDDRAEVGRWGGGDDENAC